MAAIVSIIVPAYNERERLPAFLADVRAYCELTFGENYEVIVVNDGSGDGTKELLDQATADWPLFYGIHHLHNRGKGAAVRSGMQAARGDYWLYADADGATRICEELRLRAAIGEGADISIGSRSGLGAAGDEKRPLIRRVLSGVFRHAVRLFFNVRVYDSQCGFKMFSRDVGDRLASLTQESGYLLDLEMLLLAERLGYRVVEIPVAWHDISGSKVRIVRDSWNMLWGLWRLRARLPSTRAGAAIGPPMTRKGGRCAGELSARTEVAAQIARAADEGVASRTDGNVNSVLIVS